MSSKSSKFLMLKMDYFMPTLSFKDRGAAVLISHCKSIGVTDVAQDSSGNAGNSVAAYCGAWKFWKRYINTIWKSWRFRKR